MDEILFNDKRFPVFDIYVEGFGFRHVSIESLEKELMDDSGKYVSKKAQDIDEWIFFYVDDSIKTAEEAAEFVKKHLF